MIIGEFLKNAARSKMPQHCSTDAADWCVSLGHPDFAWAWRGVMTDDDCVSATITASLVDLWEEGIMSVLPVIDNDFASGDIAVVRKMGLETGAIFTGERWAIRSGRGVTYVPLDSVVILKAWRP